MIPTKWIYSLRKDELVTYLEEFNQDSTGTVEELRRRFAQFVNKSGEGFHSRLEELMLLHGRGSSPNPLSTDPAKTGHPAPGQQTLLKVDTAAPTFDPPSTSAPNTYPEESHATTRSHIPSETKTHTSLTEERFMGIQPPGIGCMIQPPGAPSTSSPFRPTDLATVMDRVRKWSIKYSGGQGALSFIERLEEMAEAYEIHPNFIPRTLSELLQGSALVWYRCNKKPWTSWEDFKTEFLEFFLPPRYFEQLEDTVRQRQQGPRESFKEYVVALQDLMHHIPYNENQKLDRIFRNSRQEYQFHIKRREFSNLAELLVLAGDYEAVKASIVRPPIERNRQVHTGQPGNGPIDPRQACWRCGQTGHSKRQCRNPQILFCWECGHRNVRTIECCRQRMGNANGTPSPGQGSTPQ